MLQHSNNKLFIIGLPRTGTTSICISLLELGYSVAHTAYSPHCLDNAQAIADTPVFCDFKTLDKQYPNAKFIYLTRSAERWLPSIKQLLLRMQKNLTRTDGGFNPTLKRCYSEIFAPLSIEAINDDQHLLDCYQKHQRDIYDYFADRKEDLLEIDISAHDSYQKLIDFLGKATNGNKFPHVNVAGKVTYWKKIKHPLKIDSNLKAKDC
ncbi:sulfotransferase family protein [Endozoicomonas sp. G2_1]|uniref:sulfotransferase family protein n=1 Tax=Endozoicomonas sp. G2_1 TaxID=2821091 RepID=UPI001ADA2076|nr:sulfotransferase family protein [Endozoicomonas sp. G2_1]MBO9490296.1 sulfotransferase family protein [Endozoicomonas sp. G2_1]